MIYETTSPEETFALGEEFGKKAEKGQIIALTGDLGVGKTLFSKGFAKGLGISEPVSSPTFTIVKVYEGGRLPFYHFDVYRIADPDEMDEIGLDDYLFGEGASLIEWADLIEELIPDEAVRVVIEKDPEKGFDYRKITVSPGRQDG